MNERLEQYLKDNYPEIIPDNFYFECGDGWFLILNAAFREMMKIKSRKRFENAPYPRVAQIKEKFGSLRFYCDPLDGGEEYYDQIYAVVNMAETLSFRTCESCGRAGFPRGERWIKCHCRWCDTDGRETFNQEWVNGCLEMIEDEKEYLDKLSEFDQELGLE